MYDNLNSVSIYCYCPANAFVFNTTSGFIGRKGRLASCSRAANKAADNKSLNMFSHLLLAQCRPSPNFHVIILIFSFI